MRQVGRYMSAYQELRKRISFLELIRSPRIAAEASLYVTDLFDPDGIIVFSDILTVPASLGAEIEYEPGLTVTARLDELLSTPREEWLTPVYDSLALLKQEVGDEKALLGFAGAPYTLYAYLVGKGPEVRAAPLADEKTARSTIETLARVTAGHLRRQVEAGADVLQIFDTRAGELAPHHYEAFALEPLKAVIAELADLDCPIILFARGRHHVDAASHFPDAVLSVDWTVPFDSVPQVASRAVQGNLDPAVLLAGPEPTHVEAERMLESASVCGGHIANLGHGIYPTTPVEAAQEFVSTAKLYQVT
jgi:uroporphyrinogen decarboxylase